MALRQISPTAVSSSPWRRMKAICASENFDLFMVLPCPTGQATKLEFSSKHRSQNRGAGHLGSASVSWLVAYHRTATASAGSAAVSSFGAQHPAMARLLWSLKERLEEKPAREVINFAQRCHP